MAGLNFSIAIDDKQVQNALKGLLDAGQSLRPALLEIGEYLIEVHEERFSAQIGADGRRWAALSPAYQKVKKRHPDMVLVLNEYLANSFRYQADDRELLFGTDRIYAAVHQFGSPEKNIPARPFLGIAEGDQEPVQIIAEYLKSKSML